MECFTTCWQLICSYEWLEEKNVEWNTFKNWLQSRDTIFEELGNTTKYQKTTSSHREKQKQGKFTQQQRKLFNLFRVRRVQRLPVSGVWLTSKMKKLLERDKPPKHEHFKGSNRWLMNFNRRFGLSSQQKTNKKSKSVEARLPKVKRFHQYCVYQMAFEDP